MQKQQLYPWFSVDCVDFDFNFYDKKEILSKMLENQTPKKVEKFNSKGTKWELWNEIDAYFELCIEGVKLETSSCIGRFIADFLDFIPQLAYTDDKTLICPFDYEGSAHVFLTVPQENNCIRVSVYHTSMINRYDSDINFLADIVIEKDTFLKQIYDILQNAVEVNQKQKIKSNMRINRIKYTMSVLDKYFDNHEKFKEDYEPKRHIRVFDVAYKTLDNKWNFKVYLEGDTEANPLYWLKAKNEGEILDYDFIEQYSTNIFAWDEDFTNLIKLSKDDIRKDLKTDMDDRINRNWVYSAKTDSWYSTDEIMPFQGKKELEIIYSRIKYDVTVDTELYPHNEEEQLEEYIERSYNIYGELTEDDLGYLKCWLTITRDDSIVCKIEFDYRNHKEIRNALKIAHEGKYVRFNLGGHTQDKMHLWQEIYHNSKSEDATDLIIACYKNNEELYSLIVDKQEFIDCFTNALDKINHKVDVMKHIMDTGKKLDIKNKFQYDNNYNEIFENIDGFIEDYACVYKNSLYGWGIIDKNKFWVIKPDYEELKYIDSNGQKCSRRIISYIYLHNIDGKLFIAQKEYEKQHIINIKGEKVLPIEADKIKYTYLNNKLYFVLLDENKSTITDFKGEIVLTLDFIIGENIWLFDEIIIISKNEKYGIIDWNGNIVIDFIFSEIKPDKDNLDFIPVKYIKQWGFINKKGEISDIKIG